MNNKDFEKALSVLKDCHKLTDSEQEYLNNIDSQVASMEQTINDARKRIDEINLTAYRRVTGKMHNSEELEARTLRNTIAEAKRTIKKLNGMKPFYPDEYQDLLAQKEKALAINSKAVDAFRQADEAVQTARQGYDFDEIIEAEKAALIAKQTVEVTEATYNEACKALNEYQPAWEKVADSIRDQITESTKTEVCKLCSKLSEVLETGIKQMDALHSVESTFEQGKDAEWLQYHADCGWMLQLLQDTKGWVNR